MFKSMNYASTIRRMLSRHAERGVAQRTAWFLMAGRLPDDPQSTLRTVESSYSWTRECSGRWLIAKGGVKQCPIVGGEQIGLIHALAGHA